MARSARSRKRVEGVMRFGVRCLFSESMGSQVSVETSRVSMLISGVFLCSANLLRFPPDSCNIRIGISMFVLWNNDVPYDPFGKKINRATKTRMNRVDHGLVEHVSLSTRPEIIMKIFGRSHKLGNATFTAR
jgi:hypothetical protein